jgi:hypothetical protein
MEFNPMKELTDLQRSELRQSVKSKIDSGDDKGRLLSRRLLLATLALSVAGPTRASNERIDGSPVTGLPTADLPGLIVQGTKLFRGGQEYKGIGCNFYDALDHKDLRLQLSILKDYGVPFIRFDFGSFGVGRSSSDGWRRYLSDQKRWYGIRDDCVAAAEAVEIGLIPSLFWYFKTLPELMAFIYESPDSYEEWGRVNSNTRNFMRKITHEVVDRYRASPSVWGWEIGDEYLDVIFAKSIGTTPDAANSLETVGIRALTEIFNEWSSIVQSVDRSGRLLSSGLSLASSRINGLVTGSHRTPDSLDEWMNIPTAEGSFPAPIVLNPASAFNSISTHIYQAPNVAGSWFRGGPHLGPSGLITLHKQIADSYGRPVFLGEFGSLQGQLGQNGVGDTDGTKQGEIRYYEEMVETIISAGIQLSAVWNYGYLPNNHVTKWNINPGSDREYMLKSIAGANARIAPQ